MSKFAKCPCRGNKGHLGVHIIVPKQGEVSLKLTKSQRNFFLGHGIKTSDPKEVANIFIWRDTDHCFWTGLSVSEGRYVA